SPPRPADPSLNRIPIAPPNAFATGRDPNHAAVAVTEGLIEMLGSGEIAGVIGHELAHVRNRDRLISTVAALLAGISQSPVQSASRSTRSACAAAMAVRGSPGLG